MPWMIKSVFGNSDKMGGKIEINFLAFNFIFVLFLSVISSSEDFKFLINRIIVANNAALMVFW